MKMLKARVMEKMELVSLFRKECAFKLFKIMSFMDWRSQKRSTWVKIISKKRWRLMARRVRPTRSPMSMKKKTCRIRLTFKLSMERGSK